MTDRDHDDFRKLLDERHIAVMDRLGGIHEVITRQNGRVSNLEADVAVLKDRSPSRQGGIWGSVGGFAAGFVASWLKP